MINSWKQCENCSVWYNQLMGHKCPGYFETVPNNYNYKCPVCSGEFNEPARDGMTYNSHGNPKCPFCAYSMEGLK